MNLERCVSTHQRHRVALAVLLGTVLSAIPIAVLLRPTTPPPQPCLTAWYLRPGHHVVVVSAGVDGVFGTPDDLQVCR